MEEQKCRNCGCTWDNACPGGCYWVTEDLCSSCVDTETISQLLLLSNTKKLCTGLMARSVSSALSSEFIESLLKLSTEAEKEYQKVMSSLFNQSNNDDISQRKE